jgi:spermidine/putrescine transport system ATP-binding protein
MGRVNDNGAGRSAGERVMDATTDRAGEIFVDRVTKEFGELRAVFDATLRIPGGEFFSMLGPSGCGKTTMLRMIAGFEDPTAGRIYLEGSDVTYVPPAKRNVNMVFQAYGLFPHMTVTENIGFGLRIKKVPRTKIGERVAEAIRVVRLEGLEARRPGQLSGGQQQRVALARALVNRPAALLLDEPLGSLDLKLRKEMQLELKSLHARTGTTFVYVTHDQEEALTMSDRIAVMKDGVIQQVATPRELYERPVNAFVAGFIGTSNVISVRTDVVEDGLLTMRLGDDERVVALDPGGAPSHLNVSVRPEKMRIWDRQTPDDARVSRVRGVIAEVVYLGSMTQLLIDLTTGERVTVHELNDDLVTLPRIGDPVTVRWAAEHSYVVSVEDASPAGERQPGGESEPVAEAGEPAGR